MDKMICTSYHHFGQNTIYTSCFHLMFYAHTNELPLAGIVQVMHLFMGRSH